MKKGDKNLDESNEGQFDLSALLNGFKENADSI